MHACRNTTTHLFLCFGILPFGLSPFLVRMAGVFFFIWFAGIYIKEKRHMSLTIGVVVRNMKLHPNCPGSILGFGTWRFRVVSKSTYPALCYTVDTILYISLSLIACILLVSCAACHSWSDLIALDCLALFPVHPRPCVWLLVTSLCLSLLAIADLTW